MDILLQGPRSFLDVPSESKKWKYEENSEGKRFWDMALCIRNAEDELEDQECNQVLTLQSSPVNGEGKDTAWRLKLHNADYYWDRIVISQAEKLRTANTQHNAVTYITKLHFSGGLNS